MIRITAPGDPIRNGVEPRIAANAALSEPGTEGLLVISVLAMPDLLRPAALVKRYWDETLRLAAKHGAHNVRLFGSLARGDADVESDIDILVEMTPGRSFLDLVGLWQDLEELLGCKVECSRTED